MKIIIYSYISRLYIPFQQQQNQEISLSCLKDMIRYRHLVKFSFVTSKMKSHDHNYCSYCKILPSNKVDIVAISFLFLMYIECSCGMWIYLFIYKLCHSQHNDWFDDLGTQQVNICKIYQILNSSLVKYTRKYQWLKKVC